MTDPDAYRGPDRRREPRVDTDLFGSVTGAAAELRCRISNVSRIGACAVSARAVPEMAQVRLRFQSRDAQGVGEAVTCDAAVVRCHRRPDGQFNLGLFFTHVEPSGLAALDRIIAERTPSPAAN